MTYEIGDTVLVNLSIDHKGGVKPKQAFVVFSWWNNNAGYYYRIHNMGVRAFREDTLLQTRVVLTEKNNNRIQKFKWRMPVFNTGRKDVDESIFNIPFDIA